MQYAEQHYSPVGAQHLAASLRLNDVQWSRDGRRLIWHESRGGQGVLMACDPATADAAYDLSPPELAVRGRVGYGGGEFCAGSDAVFFAADGGRLYRLSFAGGPARPLTPGFGAAAAPALSPDERLLAFVHSYEGRDCLAIMPADGTQWPQQLLSGYDFVMQPAWHPAGTHLALVAWNHPHMPWDSSNLLLLTLDTTTALPTLDTVQVLAGGTDSAIFQPSFSPDGRWLAYVSDANGWGQIMLYDLHSGSTRQFTNAPAEHGQPAWVQGMRSFAWAPDSSRIYYVRNQAAAREMLVQALDSDSAQSLSSAGEYQWFAQPAVSPNTDRLAAIASGPHLPPRIIEFDNDSTRILRRSAPDPLPAAQLARPQPISWQADGVTLHGLLYLPPDRQPDSPVPAIIRVHGGPSDQADSSYQGEVQFFATRGYAVLDLNYRGSSGYGRAFLQALREGWGELDVADTLSAAAYLIDRGIADRERLLVMGSSSGGLTALLALCQAPGTFRAAAVRYPVVDLLALSAETHKFEAHYLDGLVGPLPATIARYRERSPLHQVERIRDAVAIFQGSDDPVVPPAQVEQIAEALRRRNIPLEYRLFAGEGHGFRKPETIIAYYNAVLAFLDRHVSAR